ncbi:MAG: tetratricopeptide repeat protein [Kordiimonas sp.]
MSANHERKFTLSALVLLFSCVLGVLASMPVSAQTQIIQFNPDRDIMRAQNAMRQGDLDVALVYYKRAERKNLYKDHKVIVQNSICAVAYLKENYGEAAEACSTVIEKDPKYWKAYVTRGNAKRKLGDLAGALTDFCTANRLSPENVHGAFVSRCVG